MLEREFRYYREHQDELVRRYSGQWIVIVGDAVVSSHPSQEAAYSAGVASYKKGEFLIQHCVPGSDSFTQVYHSRVAV